MGTFLGLLVLNTRVHMLRDTSPWSLATPLQWAQNRSARTVMQNSSDLFDGSSRPRPSNCSRDRFRSRRKGLRYFIVSAGLKRSLPAGTGVRVVKTLALRTTRLARSNE